MKTFVKLAACAAALAAVAACGDDRGTDGLSADERERLNALAESQDLNNADLVDTSPDSLVPEEESNAAEGDDAAAVGNAAENGAQ
ncbi:MAG TPA: hypothetical protein VEW25_12950 [Allosphingosinicella sp.]|nr:hypothetical protein [Allosphingosinicella sp.]